MCLVAAQPARLKLLRRGLGGGPEQRSAGHLQRPIRAATFLLETHLPTNSRRWWRTLLSELMRLPLRAARVLRFLFVTGAMAIAEPLSLLANLGKLEIENHVSVVDLPAPQYLIAELGVLIKYSSPDPLPKFFDTP